MMLKNGKIIVGLAFLVTLLIPFLLITSQKANAAAFAYEVYAPNRSGSTLTAWVRLSRDCSGTYGCWNYEKVEKQNPSWMWWQPWSFVDGNWVNNNGWNSVSASLPGGCGNYRTTVDSYNITVGNQGSGINLGAVGASGSGATLYEFRVTWSSGTRWYCR